MKDKRSKETGFTQREIVALAGLLVKRELASFQKISVKECPVPTRQIVVPDWGTSINRGNLSLPNLIEWCEKQIDTRHQAITAWLIAARDIMDISTMAAIKQSQIDSRKKDR